MQVLIGTLLVLGTWLFLALIVMLLGSGFAVWSQRGPVRATTIARSLWWGMAVLAILAVGVNLWSPLRSPTAVAIVGFAALLSALLAGLRARQLGWERRWNPSPGSWLLAGAFALALTYLAAMALGPVTNYDSGLYHLGAIEYAAQYPTIPGLANLHFPFGYANVEFPLAALLTNGPWGLQGLRLLNGFIMVLLVLDLVLRSGYRCPGPGKHVLVVGMTAAWIPLVALADYWVTSPTQDSAVFLVTIAAAAYLVQLVARESDWIANMGVVGALSVLLVLQRPTMVVFSATAVLVVAIVSLRRNRHRPWRLTVQLVAALGAVGAVLVLARDRILSGWAQYPLSVYPFPVEWRSPDPTPFREAILGFHRDPGNVWESVSGFGWISSWAARLGTQWETYVLLAGVALALLLLSVAVGQRVPIRWRALGIAVLPSSTMILAWWLFSPPSYRFAWGPLITAVAIPVGWLWWRLRRSPNHRVLDLALTVGVVIPVLGVAVFSAAARAPWEQFSAEASWAGIVTYRYAPLPEVATSSRDLASGLSVIQPQNGEQCWATFPLCTPLIEPTTSFRGDVLSEGFVQRSE